MLGTIDPSPSTLPIPAAGYAPPSIRLRRDDRHGRGRGRDHDRRRAAGGFPVAPPSSEPGPPPANWYHGGSAEDGRRFRFAVSAGHAPPAPVEGSIWIRDPSGVWIGWRYDDAPLRGREISSPSAATAYAENACV